MSVRWDIAPAVGVTAGVGRRARWDGMRSAMSGVVCEIRRYVHTFGEVPFSGKSSSPVTTPAVVPRMTKGHVEA